MKSRAPLAESGNHESESIEDGTATDGTANFPARDRDRSCITLA